MTIGDLIMQKRKALKLTLEDVAAAVGVSKGTVSRWESGDIRKIKRDKIDALSSVLELDPLVFFQEAEILTPPEKQILNAYRRADSGIQRSVRRLLEIPEEEKDTRPAGKAI